MNGRRALIAWAWMVSSGLVLVGIALGLLYFDFRESQVVNLKVLAKLSEKGIAVPNQDDPALKLNWARMISAMVTGTLGAGSTAFGIIMLLASTRWFRTTEG